MPCIAVSKKCPAGMNILQKLKAKGFQEAQEKFDGNPVLEKNGIKLVQLNELHIFAENISQFETDAVVFATTHKSEKGEPSLSVHPVGNFGKAELGGKDRTLVLCSAVLNKKLILKLKELAEKEGLGELVTAECSHHGPWNNRPTCFIEIGSSEKQWQDENLGNLVAETLVQALTEPEKKFRIAIGCGGTHYCPEFNKILFRTDIALSHIIPKYALDKVDFDLFKQAVEKTQEKVEFVLLDWKGLNAEQRQKVKGFAAKLGLACHKTKEFL